MKAAVTDHTNEILYTYVNGTWKPHKTTSVVGYRHLKLSVASVLTSDIFYGH